MINHYGMDGGDIEIVYCGIDLDTFKPLPHEFKEKFILLNVARLTYLKGQKYLIDACKILKDKGLDFECLIIGGGSRMEELQNQISELELKDFVILMGAVENGRLPEYYNKADIFVLPSLSESLGKVSIEALACSTPVIASDVKGVPEVVQDNVTGFLIDPKNPIQLADSILRLKEDSALLDNFKRNARRTVEQKFDIKKNTLQLESIFKKVAP